MGFCHPMVISRFWALRLTGTGGRWGMLKIEVVCRENRENFSEYFPKTFLNKRMRLPSSLGIPNTFFIFILHSLFHHAVCMNISWPICLCLLPLFALHFNALSSLIRRVLQAVGPVLLPRPPNHPISARADRTPNWPSIQTPWLWPVLFFHFY